MQAEQFLSEFLSIISDGMQQEDCKIAWCANYTRLQVLTHHIQGLIVHTVVLYKCIEPITMLVVVQI